MRILPAKLSHLSGQEVRILFCQGTKCHYKICHWKQTGAEWGYGKGHFYLPWMRRLHSRLPVQRQNKRSHLPKPWMSGWCGILSKSGQAFGENTRGKSQHLWRGSGGSYGVAGTYQRTARRCVWKAEARHCFFRWLCSIIISHGPENPCQHGQNYAIGRCGLYHSGGCRVVLRLSA